MYLHIGYQDITQYQNTTPIIRKFNLEDHGESGCPARQVLAKHQGAVSKSYPQVKLCHLSIPLSTYFSIFRKMVRGGYSYKMNEEQEELLHKLRDFNTLRDNAGAWEENLLTAEELI